MEARNAGMWPRAMLLLRTSVSASASPHVRREQRLFGPWSVVAAVWLLTGCEGDDGARSSDATVVVEYASSAVSLTLSPRSLPDGLLPLR